MQGVSRIPVVFYPTLREVAKKIATIGAGARFAKLAWFLHAKDLRQSLTEGRLRLFLFIYAWAAFGSSVEECHRAFHQVIDRAHPNESFVPSAVVLLDALKEIISKDFEAGQTTNDLRIHPRFLRSPLEVGPEGSRTAYHSGAIEDITAARKAQDFDALTKRIDRVRKGLSDAKPERFKYFETTDENTPKDIRDLIEKGKALMSEGEKEEELRRKAKWNVWCGGSLGVVGLLASAFVPTGKDNSWSVPRRVLNTTVTDLKSHVKLLNEVLKDVPEKDEWIRDHLSALGHEVRGKGQAASFPFFNRFDDYKGLNRMSKSEFLSTAFRLASKGRIDVSTISVKELNAERESARGHLKAIGEYIRTGLLTQDELREWDQLRDVARLDYVYLTLGAGAIAGAAAGVLACHKLAVRLGVPGYQAQTGPLAPTGHMSPTLDKMVQALGVSSGTSPRLTHESVWLDAESPDGAYTMVLLEIDRSTRSTPKLRGFTFTPGRKEAVVQPLFQPTAAAPVAEVSSDAKLALLKRRLITHTFAIRVSDDFLPAKGAIDAAFSEASELKLSDQELSKWERVVDGIGSERDLVRLTHALRDIKTDRLRAEEDRKQREEEENARQRPDRPSVYVPSVQGLNSVEDIVRRLRGEINTDTFSVKYESFSKVQAIFDYPSRDEIVRALEQDFAWATQMQLEPDELKQLERAVAETLSHKRIWFLHTAESHIRRTLVNINEIRRTLNLLPGGRVFPIVAFPIIRWDTFRSRNGAIDEFSWMDGAGSEFWRGAHDSQSESKSIEP